MGLRAGWIALFLFVWLIGAFLGSTFEYQTSTNGEGITYTTGTATFANGSTTVVGAGTAWANLTMAGGNIKSDTDGVWYKIQSVSDVTHLTLYAQYQQTGGVGMAYTMAQSPGWAGTGTAGYDQSPVTTMEYLTQISNAFQRVSILGNIPLPIPNSEYFKALGKVVTWQWSFMDGYEMFYWIFCAPFVAMGIFSMLMLTYGLLTGNLDWG